MQKVPEERFPTVSEFARALEAAATGAETATTLPPDLRQTAPATIDVHALPVPEVLPTSTARSEHATPIAGQRPPTPSVPVTSVRGSSPPSKPLIQEARTPPPTPMEHRVETFTPASRRVPYRTPISQPKSPMPDPPASRREPAVEGPSGSVPPYERVSRTPPPPSAPPSELSDRDVTRAQQELEEARSALKLGRLDQAVLHAEHLLELAAFGKNTRAVYELLKSGMPVVDHIFEARVGPLDRRLEITEAARDPKKINLSAKAAFVLSCAEGGATIQEVIDASGIPRRDVIRMLAGLLRRGALIAH
jgi:hypothetical protein